ncbi:MAG: hypothetical protein ACYSUN_03935 [Planctomycetota bacterium]|jgi:hypothetical protein
MSEKAENSQPKKKREKYMTDKGLQWAVTLQILAALAGVAVLYAIGIYVLPGQEALEDLNAEETRAFLLRANLIYFVLATGIIGTLAMLLMHRIAGPARVMRQAVEDMENGNYETRLSLRRFDYLKPLAASIANLRDDLRRQEAKRRELLKTLHRCLQENDLAAAREILVQLGLGEDAKQPETEPTAQEA